MSVDDRTKTEWFFGVPSNGDKLGPGSVVGEYVIEDVIGSGGFAQVYRARHRILGRAAAVKVLSREMAQSSEMVQRFVREAVVVNRIHHPNIVDIYDFGQLSDGRPYFIMELLNGRSLTAVLAARGRCSVAEAIACLEPICSALQAAHEAGVVHRDLKTSNIMVCGEDGSPTVKLLDFGIAKLLYPQPGEVGLSVEGRKLGTAHAMAPEQIRGGTIDVRTDVYALGVLLFRLLTDQNPFQSRDPLELERLHLFVPPPHPSQIAPIPPAIEAVILRCLEKARERRYPSAQAVMESLRAAVAGETKNANETHFVQAAAIFAEVRLDESAHEDQAALANLAYLLDWIEQGLTEAGFAMLLQTGSSLLGVREMPKDGAEASRMRGQLLKLARDLFESSRSQQRDQRLEITICAHVGQGEARNTPEGPKITGGPVAQLEDWVVRGSEGWHATPQVDELSESGDQTT